jgi:hypothetical protein
MSDVEAAIQRLREAAAKCLAAAPAERLVLQLHPTLAAVLIAALDDARREADRERKLHASTRTAEEIALDRAARAESHATDLQDKLDRLQLDFERFGRTATLARDAMVNSAIDELKRCGARGRKLQSARRRLQSQHDAAVWRAPA